MLLTLDVVEPGLALGVEGVERLFQTVGAERWGS